MAHHSIGHLTTCTVLSRRITLMPSAQFTSLKRFSLAQELRNLFSNVSRRHTATAAVEEAGRGVATQDAAQGIIQDYFATDKRPIILFDGVCNLCNGAVNLMLDIDPQGAFRLGALQSPAGMKLLQRCGRASDDISSIVLVEENGFHIQSEAVLQIAQGLQVPFPILAAVLLPVPRLIRDPLYDLVANNRYTVFGRTDRCRMSDAKYTERFVTD